MDITSSPTSGAPPTKSPEPEPDTQNRTHQGKSFNFTNGVLKRHHSATAAPVVYKECLKNHAASLGGLALDGCGEFMPSPSATADPTSLKCAACGCHRNFHRREPEDHFHPLTPTTHVIEYHPHHRHHPPPPPPPTQQPTRPAPHGGARSPSSQSPPPISSTYYPASAPHMLLALSGGNPVEQSAHHHHNMINSSPLGSSLGRKRFRTKFSQNQKDRMYEFAEKLGWRMQKSTDELVMKFCSEVGVERGVFKVWMHNNKSTYGKRSAADNSGGGGGGGEPQHGVDNGNNSSSNNNNDMEGHHHHQNHNIFSHGHYNSSSSKNVEGNVHNGSSSSS